MIGNIEEPTFLWGVAKKDLCNPKLTGCQNFGTFQKPPVLYSGQLRLQRNVDRGSPSGGSWIWPRSVQYHPPHMDANSSHLRSPHLQFLFFFFILPCNDVHPESPCLPLNTHSVTRPLLCSEPLTVAISKFQILSTALRSPVWLAHIPFCIKLPDSFIHISPASLFSNSEICLDLSFSKITLI